MLTDKNIVYSTADFLVVDKPPGLSVQTEASSPGCIDLLKSFVGEGQLHPVHRLDKVTSGLLLVARTAEANQELSMLFQRRNIQKYYVALSNKRPAKKQGAIIGDMTKSRNGCWKLLREKRNPAITQFFNYGIGEGLRAFIVKLHTGKTHQIRVALKSLGSPILGDQAYGGAVADRVYLHAAALKFEFSGQNFQFSTIPTLGKQFAGESFIQFFERMPPPDELQWPRLK